MNISDEMSIVFCYTKTHIIKIVRWRNICRNLSSLHLAILD